MVVNGDIEIERESAVASVLLAYVNEQVHTLKEQELKVRRGTPDSVHQMRVAVRCLRSVFATYGALLDIDVVDHLREELRWLGLVLGAERDAEVMRKRLTELIESELTGREFESATHHFDEQITADLNDAHLVVLETLNNERYVQFLNDLGAFLANPPLTTFANEPIKKIVPNLVKKDWIRLRRTVAELKGGRFDRESALHEVRKDAKRLRYAAETAELVHYKWASKLAEAAEEVQTILGDYHDSVVARDLLRRLNEQVTATDASDFDFEHLVALEERNAMRAEIQFRKVWKRFPATAL